MPINFIPNDPDSQDVLPMRQVSPRPDRGVGQAKIVVDGAVAENKYDVGTTDFLYWQCREAMLASLDAWELIHGPFSSWQDGDTLPIFKDAGVDLNAFYDRKRGGQPERLSFFHEKVGTKTYFSGASTDVVSHEAGHAFLDAIRPDFWTSTRFEVNSIHEAFGDCIAILTALHDKVSRVAILSDIASKNVVESTAEELSAGIGKKIPGHNAGAPRRARNNFEWGPQGSLPDVGGPGELIFEEHSFGQIFSGCFYDTIVNIFNGMASQSEGNLLKATQTAGKILVKAIRQAPQRLQYFREVGRFMILADEADNAGANRDAIRDAFQRHNISLGSTLTLAPQAVIASTLATSKRAAMSGRGAVSLSDLTAHAKGKVLNMMGAVSRKLDVSSVKIAGTEFQEAVHQRIVTLDGVHKKLKGVVAEAAQVALIGRSHSSMAIMGHVSNPVDTDNDVENYVQSLVKHGRIDFEPKKSGGRSLVAKVGEIAGEVTHEIREIRGQKTLVRIRYSCRG
jgi:hypothetical protein